MDKSKRHLAWWVVGLLAVAAIVAWWLLRPAGVPEGFAVSNGRIEATEVDIASKIAGRIDTILVKEGQFVREGEVLAKMDTRVLQEQRLEAIAQIKEAQSAVAAAQALLEQRQSETRAAQSLVNQRQGRTGLRSKTSYAFPFTGPTRGLFLRNSWMTIAPPLRAPELRWNRRKLRYRLLKRL